MEDVSHLRGPLGKKVSGFRFARSSQVLKACVSSGFSWPFFWGGITCVPVFSGRHTVDGKNLAPPCDVENPVNNGINYQPQLVQDFFH